ncbi:MAG: HD domain-containing protein, partial [bacterium]|nr:HD domain-containing protein [bacterium]
MITTEISRLVEGACRKETNFYGYGAWSYHFVPVVKNSLILAGKLGADQEIVELAALLHDYASVIDKDLYPEHHLHSARLAGEVLKSFQYPEEKIVKIQRCILNHRSSLKSQRETIEEKILAD